MQKQDSSSSEGLSKEGGPIKPSSFLILNMLRHVGRLDGEESG